MTLALEVVLRPASPEASVDVPASIVASATLPAEHLPPPRPWWQLWRADPPADAPHTLRLTLARWRNLADARKAFDVAAGRVATAARSGGWRVEETAIIAEDGERVAVELPAVKAVARLDAEWLTLPPLDGEAMGRQFARLQGREAQVRLVYDAIADAVRSKFTRRPHVLLHGPAGCGKSELVKAFAAWLGAGAVWHLDATTLTKAGLESELLARSQDGTLAPILVPEEIEKAPAGVLRCLLQVMDTRGKVQRTNARTGDVTAECRPLVIATCNDLAKLGKLYAGALASRFAFKLHCDRLDPDALRAILAQHCAAAGGKPEWVDAVMGFLAERDCYDPRFALSLLAGGDRLLDNGPAGFLADLRRVAT